jgi:hypothetical protein
MTYDLITTASLSFSAGFIHDLSLITDENLMELTSPPGFSIIDYFIYFIIKCIQSKDHDTI